MTNEELEKEAVEYAEKINLQNVNISGVVRNHISQAYLAGAEPREKRIAKLEAQIEKMKNCRNCKNEKIEGACGHFIQVGWCKNWELAK